MKIFKILGIVAIVHVAAVLLLFATQGCRSTAKSEPASAAGASTAPVTVQYGTPVDASTVAPSNGTDLNASAGPAPTVSFNAPSGSDAFYSPTRPGTPAAVAIESSTPVTGVTPAATYTVAKGDSLWKIADKHHISVSTLARANNLKPHSMLQVGQKLVIPGTPTGAVPSEKSAGPTYKVKPGDSLAIIARRTGTTVAALRSLNHLKSDNIRVDQELKLPPGAPGATETTGVSSTMAPASSKNPAGAVTHIVKPGEKLSTIAKKYGVSVGELATANNISDPGKIRAGQELIIPGWTAPGGKPGKPTAPNTNTPPSLNSGEDLDAGLKPSTEPPVIKVDETPPAPATTSDTGTSQAR
ncbi:MAG: LysM peptidoglycan-binding domain-containing protein [Verrucomicrobiota bacterium]|nr:LysM peptidoglycan-binding domain-containing protein [Verrucomicrobiota bacterium]